MIPARPNGPSRASRGVRRSAESNGIADTRWLVIAGVAALVVAVAIASFRNGADEQVIEDPINGAAPADPADTPAVTVQAPVMAQEVVSRVDAARAPQPLVATDEGVPAASHIGLRDDPLAEPYDPSDAAPRHLGRQLDPDGAYTPTAQGEASHIGEHLDPVADD